MLVLVKQCEECSFSPPPALPPILLFPLPHFRYTASATSPFPGGGSWSLAKWGSRGGGEGGRWVQRAAEAAEGKRRNLPDGKRGGGGWEKVLPYIGGGGEGTEEEEAK